ncbi:sensor domain-containing diguanylate cyclase [Paenibacillus sp. GD4]|uniref:sensor domain-containing diguanylate cyclase n=1 Tax=Paenibacillus sp. GD4 TaxID=3068890 RepID=UPI002796503C|nr:sensor domain-containing diguanylate cyclase [Paenibacillus sp. GD4]MDQ1912351.1 sensor domain-containing diguanylate cyclase [Paenibacillus sp. GD4]
MDQSHPRPPSDDLFRLLVETSTDFIQVMDSNGRISYVSPSLPTFFRRTAEAYAGTSWIDWVHENDRPVLEQSVLRLLRNGQPFTQEYRLPLSDGTYLWLEGKGTVLPSGDPQAYAAIYSRDISRLKQHEEQLTKLAYYDALTGLPNRRLFQDRYSQLLLSSKRYGHRLGILYLDLDDFKQINDQYGHSYGDEFLRLVAARLHHSIRDPDTVCRVGGDEFVMLLQRFETKEDLGRIAVRVIEALNHPFELNGYTIRVTCSIGGASFPEDATDGEQLLRRADNAMYEAKKIGKNNYFLYSHGDS